MKRQKILYGAGLTGKMALKHFGEENVFCFIDNIKNGQQFFGKEIISFEQFKEIKEHYEVVITISDTKFKLIKEIKNQLKNNGVIAKTFLESIDVDSLSQNSDILQFENRHIGESCFVIGNGPSLTYKDLDRIKQQNFISFGSNRISEIFSETNWRPNYYMVQDPLFVSHYSDIISSTEVEHKFIPNPKYTSLNDSDELEKNLNKSLGYLHYYFGVRLPFENINFSTDLSKMFTLGGTVTGGLIQLAIYMGFKKIYLLGVDGTNSIVSDKNYFSEKRHFYNESLKGLEQTYIMNNIDDAKILEKEIMTQLNAFALRNNVNVYNATRGGVLEVFERVDVEDII